MTQVCQACGLSSVEFSSYREYFDFAHGDTAHGMSCRYCELRWTERDDASAIARARERLREKLQAIEA